jgi:hypothetical protein
VDRVVLERALAVAAGASSILPPGLSQSCDAAVDLLRGLVVYWPFESEPGVSALNLGPTGLLFDGLKVGNPPQVPGLLGDAREFSNAGQMVVESDAAALKALRAFSEFTLSAWIYPLGATASSGSVIVNKEGEYEIARLPDGRIDGCRERRHLGGLGRHRRHRARAHVESRRARVRPGSGGGRDLDAVRDGLPGAPQLAGGGLCRTALC